MTSPVSITGREEDDLNGSLSRYSRQTDSLNELSAYYRGRQRLTFLSPSVRSRLQHVVINIPRLVVDAIEHRLDVDGFRMGGSPQADADLWRIWQHNDLDEWSQQAHLDALIYGRSYVMVWGDENNPDVPCITVESARQLSVDYDLSQTSLLGGRGVVTRAVKRWTEGDTDYATVYTENLIQRYAAPAGTSGDRIDWRRREVPRLNTLGAVPIVPLLNRPTLTMPLGESEMTDVIPVADAINKLATDMMVSAEYHAMPRRWATGIDLGGNDDEAERTSAKVEQKWTQAEAGRVWLSDSSDTTFGQFPEANLDNFIGAINMYTARAAAITGLPPHYFGQAGENPASADALRASEASLVERAKRKHKVFGGSWERVMRLALLVRDGEISDAARSMETIWAKAETPSVAQEADAAVKLYQAGITTKGQAREDLSYTPEQRDRMKDEDDATALGAVSVQLAEAQRLQDEQGLSQQAAFAAVGLLQAAAAIGAPTRRTLERDAAGNITAITEGS